MDNNRKRAKLNVATAVVHCKENCSSQNEDRTHLLEKIIEASADSDVILLPAGYYKSKSMHNRERFNVEKQISSMLQNVKSSAVVCVGFDFRAYSIDQIAYAIGTQGIIAAGRKFYPTNGERGVVVTAKDFMAKESENERTFQVNGLTCYLAVCYDCFGIRHLNTRNPGVDIVLNLVHGFHKKGEGSSGDVDFARKGFAGASMHWHCPVFGTAVFWGRAIPENWPTGVMWSGAESVKSFKYADNQLHWAEKSEVMWNTEDAIIYKYIVNG